MNKRLLSLLLVLPMVATYVQATAEVSVKNPYPFDIKYKTNSQERDLKNWKRNENKHFSKGATIYLHDSMGEYLGRITA